VAEHEGQTIMTGIHIRKLAVWCCPEPDPARLSASLTEWLRSSTPDQLVDWIEREGVASLCGYQLKRLHPDVPPEGLNVAKRLIGAYYRTTARNVLRYHHLGLLLEEFDQAGLSVLMLKGAALALSVYPEVGLREMSDVDLLVRPEQLQTADRLLTIEGYQAVDRSAIDLARPPSEHLTTLDYRDLQGVKPAIHLHWHLINSTVPHADYSRRIDLEGVWARAGRLLLKNRSILELSPSDAVLYLSEHAMRVSHSLNRLMWLADLAWLIDRRRDQLDWNEIERRARLWGIDRLVRPVYTVIRAWFGVPMPDQFVEAFRQPPPSWEERLFCACLARSIRHPGLSYLVHLALRRKAMEKSRFVMATVCPPKPALAQHFFLSPMQMSSWRYLNRLAEIMGFAARLCLARLSYRKSTR
jgi:hypothetical protein